MAIEIDAVSDAQHLRRMWKNEVRKNLRTLTFRDGNLAADVLAYAGYEWGLDALLEQLALDLRDGSYVSEKAEIVRAAKSSGLSRPLCFLTVRDALVYRAITFLAREDLTRGAREYAAFLRSDKGDGLSYEEVPIDSFDWFSFWLQREGRIAHWMEDPEVSFIVESDIANFYPSIRNDAIREHLHSVTDLSKEVVRLCVQLIDRVMPRTDYSENSMLGLPQEVIGSSREIAHSLLLYVDEEFRLEGAAGRYTRFMDDMMVGVPDRETGLQCISRLQRALEALGLYPNASKTRIVAFEEFLRESMVETNGELERLDRILQRSEDGELRQVFLDEQDLGHLRALSNEFRELDDRPRRWDRVMRRFYLIHRRLGIRDWWDFWFEDLKWSPSSSAQILEFVRSWPLSTTTIDRLHELSVGMGELYPDIAVFTGETLAVAPVPPDAAIWSHVATTALREVERLHAAPRSMERACAAWAVAAYKYGDDAQRAGLAELMRRTDAQSPLREQGLTFHVGGGRPVSDWILTEPGITTGSALNTAYLRALQEGDERAEGVALSVLNPAPRLSPLRYCISPRTLPLLDALGHRKSPRLEKVVDTSLKRLERNEDRLRDHRSEWLFSSWVQ